MEWKNMDQLCRIFIIEQNQVMTWTDITFDIAWHDMAWLMIWMTRKMTWLMTWQALTIICLCFSYFQFLLLLHKEEWTRESLPYTGRGNMYGCRFNLMKQVSNFFSPIILLCPYLNKTPLVLKYLRMRDGITYP